MLYILLTRKVRPSQTGDEMPVQGTSETNKKRQTMITIRERLRDKYPEFDEQKHKVFVNGEQVDPGHLDRLSTPFDIVSIQSI